MKRLILCIAILAMGVGTSFAGEWQYKVEGNARALYGYTDVKKHHHGVGIAAINASATYTTETDMDVEFHFDLTGGIDREIQSYNQGQWGEEAYVIVDSSYGQLMAGQIANVAALFHNGAPSTGALRTNNDIADFLTSPDWQRTKNKTYFATLNATEINTDGVAPKLSYVTPEAYGTALGFSYMPESYNRRGLINKHAGYAHKDGFVGAVYNDHDWGMFSTQTALGYAVFHGNDKEVSYSLRFSRGNWSLGGGWRKTYIDGDDKINNRAELEAFFDGYREGQAWNIGLGYEIGPFSSGLTYFASRAATKTFKSETVAFSNQYQFNKHTDFYVAAAWADYKSAREDRTGYAIVSGIGVHF